jgi:uncharacterized protein YciW
MSQIVKIQINADINDVADITSATFQQTLHQIDSLRKIIVDAKTQLSRSDIFDPEDRAILKKTITQLEDTKSLINKIDMRISDVLSITSGLVSVFEKEEATNVEPTE